MPAPVMTVTGALSRKNVIRALRASVGSVIVILLETRMSATTFYKVSLLGIKRK